MLLAPADARADRIQLQVQLLRNLFVFQFFYHILDHHVFIQRRQLVDEAHQPAVDLVVDDFLFRGVVRELGAAAAAALFFLVLPLDAGEVVQRRACCDGEQPRLELPGLVEGRQGGERLLEAFQHHVVYVGLPMEIAAHAPADRLLVHLIQHTVGRLVTGNGPCDDVFFVGFHINVLPAS